MDDDAIREMAAQLEGVAPSSDAKVRITQHGGGPDESHIVANRAGYLRLAALFLQAAVSPPEANPPTVLSPDAEELFDEDSDIFFHWLERREQSESPPLKTPLISKDRVSLFLEGIGCYSVIAVVLYLLAVGLITVCGWIFR